MAFTSTGTFSTGGTQTVSPLQDLLLQNKKLKQPATATTTPANVFASPEPNRTASSGETVAPAFNPADQNTGETLDEYKKRIAQTQEDANPSMPDTPAEITPETHYINNDPNSPYYWETLGYPDETWAGLPYEMGFWQDNGDGTQTWIQQRDMTSVATQMHDLSNMPGPNLQDLTGTDAYAGIQSLIDLWNDPNTAQADKDAAVASFEQEMGQAPGWFAEQMAQMYGQMSQGISGQQGLTDEYQQAFNRETDLEMQKMKSEYGRLIESMSASGRNVAGYQKMDEIVNSMASFDAKRRMERMNLDMAYKQAEYDALKDRYQQLFDMKQISASEYMGALQQNRTNALTGYAQELSAAYQQNQTEIAAYTAHAQVVYQSILADMQVSESMMNQMQDYYEMYMAPYYAELERWSIEKQVALQEKANQINALSGIPIIGGIAAAIASSVVCTELHRQGFMDDETYEIDTRFGTVTKVMRPDVYAGYLKLASPLIPLMRKSKALSWIVNIFVRRWSEEMSHRMGVRKRGSLLGKLIMTIGFPLCSLFGREVLNGKMA